MTRSPDNDPARQWQADPTSAWRSSPLSWQHYAADLHEGLLRRWRGVLPAGALVLKTDLFEEALGEDHPAGRIVALGWRPLGMDVGRGIAWSAWRRGKIAGALGPVVSDVRRLAFATGSLAAVFSNSTLDHFAGPEDLDTALAEIYRVLRPGGRLLLTLDNPRHPVVALRNALPRRLTDALGITDFYVGRTLSLRGAEARLRERGFEILGQGTFMHALRYLALPLLRRLEQAGRSGRRVVRMMLALEGLSHWPTAQFTSHFIFVEARKPEAAR